MTTADRRKSPSPATGAPRSRAKKSPGVSANVLTRATPAVVDSLTGEELGAEALSVRQRVAAHRLAVGGTQQQAADAVGVEARTIRRWCDDPTFAALVEHLHVTAWQRVEPAVFATLELAIGVIQQMLRGELEADDKRVQSAERLLDRLLNRLFDIGTAPANPPPALDGPGNTAGVIEGTVV